MSLRPERDTKARAAGALPSLVCLPCNPSTSQPKGDDTNALFYSLQAAEQFVPPEWQGTSWQECGICLQSLNTLSPYGNRTASVNALIEKKAQVNLCGHIFHHDCLAFHVITNPTIPGLCPICKVPIALEVLQQIDPSITGEATALQPVPLHLRRPTTRYSVMQPDEAEFERNFLAVWQKTIGDINNELIYWAGPRMPTGNPNDPPASQQYEVSAEVVLNGQVFSTATMMDIGFPVKSVPIPVTTPIDMQRYSAALVPFVRFLDPSKNQWNNVGVLVPTQQCGTGLSSCQLDSDGIIRFAYSPQLDAYFRDQGVQAGLATEARITFTGDPYRADSRRQTFNTELRAYQDQWEDFQSKLTWANEYPERLLAEQEEDEWDEPVYPGQ